MNFTLNKWESDFFNRKIANVEFEKSDQFAEKNDDPTAYDLIRTKISSGNLEKITLLQQNGFHLVEGEVDFCIDLNIANLNQDRTACEVATAQDIPELETIFGTAFPNSRFRAPYFSEAENTKFYKRWIDAAVKAEFDDLCLIIKENNQIKGGISLRHTDEGVRVGLLAVAPQFQRQGVAKALLNEAMRWAKEQNTDKFWIATQVSNLPAINTYIKIGGKIHETSYWFYKNNNKETK